MHDKNKNKKSQLADFLRYRKDEMTGEERNSFERELQKDPFTEESADGFLSVLPEEALVDITDLQKRLKSRTVRRQRFTYYRIAASVAVLMVISTVFIIVKRNRTSDKMTETPALTQAFEITKDQPLTKPIKKEVESAKFAGNSEKKKDKSEQQQIRREPDAGKGQSEKLKLTAVKVKDSIPAQEIKSALEYTADEQLAAPVAVLARANSASQLYSRTDTSISELTEVVMIDYGLKKVAYEKEGIRASYTYPQPVTGKSEFERYIESNLHRPDTLTAGQRVVVAVSFIVHTDGSLDSIRIVRSPGKSFSDEAIRIIKSGPKWKPAEENGKPVEDEVKVRIVFR